MPILYDLARKDLATVHRQKLLASKPFSTAIEAQLYHIPSPNVSRHDRDSCPVDLCEGFSILRFVAFVFKASNDLYKVLPSRSWFLNLQELHTRFIPSSRFSQSFISIDLYSQINH